MAGLARGSTIPDRNAGRRDELNRRVRNRLLCKGALWISLIVSGYQALWTYYLAGTNVPDYELDMETGRKRVRRRPEHLKKVDPQTGNEVPTSPLDGIMEGYLALVDIFTPKSGLRSTPTQKYSNVKAQFCHINWQAQQENPSKVPMFKDLQSASPLCPGTSYTVDLWDVTRKARDYDRRNHTFAATTPREGQGPVPPTAVVFHETRCGSTLIANELASLLPKHVRVFSESPPPVEALRTCDFAQCDPGAQEALIQDVFYMMGRVTRAEKPQYAFYKIQSIGARSISAFARAMPQTPWIFNYRDSVEVMMSHFKNYQTGNPLSEDFFPVCLRSWGRKDAQHPSLLDLVRRHNTTWDALSKEEYCAAHLASLSESAVRQHEKAVATGTSTPHWFVNYKSLPHYLWEHKLLETIIGSPVDKDMVDRMSSISHSYSKGRPMRSRTWKEDSSVKQARAPEVIRRAVAKFLDPVFARMEEIRQSQEL